MVGNCMCQGHSWGGKLFCFYSRSELNTQLVSRPTYRLPRAPHREGTGLMGMSNFTRQHEPRCLRRRSSTHREAKTATRLRVGMPTQARCCDALSGIYGTPNTPRRCIVRSRFTLRGAGCVSREPEPEDACRHTLKSSILAIQSAASKESSNY